MMVMVSFKMHALLAGRTSTYAPVSVTFNKPLPSRHLRELKDRADESEAMTTAY